MIKKAGSLGINNMREFTLYLKSHTFAPDYEATIKARDWKEAKERFYASLHGEVSIDDIEECMEEI